MTSEFLRASGLPPLFDEEGWLGGHTFADRVSWLPDEEAARLWGEPYRSGTRDVEELKYDLDHIAYLHPAEADACLHWLRNPPASEQRPECEPEELDYLTGLVRANRHLHELAAAPPAERRRQQQRLRELPRDDPQWYEIAHLVLLAEARADPRHAAELALEFWCQRASSDPPGEQEIARRLWLLDPDAALSYLDRQQQTHWTSLLPILLQRVLIHPSPGNLHLAQELLTRFHSGSWTGLCVAVVRVLGTLERWEPAARLVLLEAAVHSVARFVADDDWTRLRHAAFKTELIAHLPSLPIPPHHAATLAKLLVTSN